MADVSPHQQKIIKRYYDNIDTIQLARLAELVRVAAGVDAGFPRAGSGHHEHGAFGVEDGLALRRIQVGEVGLRGRRGHRSIVAAPSVTPCRLP